MSKASQAAALKVLIAGAGIGGLSAAIALRQAGHAVEIFESSKFAAEVGAAIHLPPNVNVLLRQFGMNPEEHGANDTEWVTVMSSQGDIISQKSLAGLKNEYPCPWQLIHRVDLHESLKTIATSPEGKGTPAVLHLGAKVVSCDPAKPSVLLDNGRVIEGDLLIGADGSALRAIISGEDIPTFPSGGSAFRFLVPINEVKTNPETASLVARRGELQIWEGKFRRLVIYPCRHNTELNFVCLHPDTASWNNAASVEDLLKVFSEYFKPMQTLLGMADPSTIKLWKLFDRRVLKTWVNGCAALLGDAAHPFLPHQGQGGAQAIEDAAALGALFPMGTRKEDVQRRLGAYMEARYDRATMVQDFSRQMAFQTDEQDKVGGFSMDPMEFSKINFNHNAYVHAREILNQQL
ncbi:FAD-dependent monooxygenase OpS4 [Colletotrichum asianum]|uniref:FAD-dependent monooxygenase OpS4 n=1 Tax=Colletotrichum asianum TaxID=702518 RepID=A0A8H3WC48_9PEZI|nr:FAD-dependent monooxygenase OpS4 [Colletotrichum asianum]